MGLGKGPEEDQRGTGGGPEGDRRGTRKWVGRRDTEGGRKLRRLKEGSEGGREGEREGGRT